MQNIPKHSDPNINSRKQDHIELAFQSQIDKALLDQRFYYEPLLAAHPERNSFPKIDFLQKEFRVPIWVSSMTGGTQMAHTINHNLARACKDFGMGMGLGSCRSLLFDDEYLADFDVRHLMGDDLALYANLGIAQVEQLLASKDHYLIAQLIDKLKADGLIIHVNPLQEWLQPEGDRFLHPPIDTIKKVLELFDFPIIVKEVGQGMGYHSLKALLQLPLAAIDFAASGGTNFSKLELLRSKTDKQEIYQQLALLGHSAEEMVAMTNKLLTDLGDKIVCKQIIISGGIKHFLDGYYLINKLALPCIYGQASSFLKHAQGTYENLYHYIDAQIQGLELAQTFLKLKD